MTTWIGRIEADAMPMNMANSHLKSCLWIWKIRSDSMEAIGVYFTPHIARMSYLSCYSRLFYSFLGFACLVRTSKDLVFSCLILCESCLIHYEER